MKSIKAAKWVLGLMMSDSGSVISIGDREDVFKSAFPRSPSDSRSLKGELPIGATGDHWEAIGWELDNASRGVGAVLYDGRIAVAMSQIDKVEEEDVTRESQKYEFKLGPPTKLEGNHVRYWFWPDDAGTLMVCAFKNDRNEINLTTALGDSGVMDKLRMSYQTAREDMGSVERLYNPIGSSRQVSGSTK